MKSLALSCAVGALSLLFFPTSAAAQKRKPPVRQAPAKIVSNCPGSGLTDGEVVDILAAHNKARQKVGLPPLRWSCTLGREAAAWAAKGTFAHSGTSLGENVFVSSAADDKVTTAVDKWEDEHHNWNNKTGTCESGKTCTHYTQIVWRSTKTIGCAINRNVSGQWKLMLVCNYDPAALSGKAY